MLYMNSLQLYKHTKIEFDRIWKDYEIPPLGFYACTFIGSNLTLFCLFWRQMLMRSSLYPADLAFLFHTPEYFHYWHKSFRTRRSVSLSKTQWGREKAESYRRVSRAWITYVFLWFRWGTRWGGQRNFQGRNEWARRQCFSIWFQ